MKTSPPFDSCSNSSANIEINIFNDTLSANTFPISFSEIATIFNQSLTCPSKSHEGASVDAGVLATANVTGQATLNYSVAAAGTVVPPTLLDFGIGTCKCYPFGKLYLG